MRTLLLSVLMALTALPACTAGPGPAGDDLAGPGGSAGDGSSSSGGGDGGVGCGAARGEFVPPQCEPSGAKVEDGCRCIIGWHFDGKRCTALGGCRCVESCDRVYKDQGTCERAYVRCLTL
jgi:hypothetical protein